jgi:acetolactate synthase-1/2/3 large subunit
MGAAPSAFSATPGALTTAARLRAGGLASTDVAVDMGNSAAGRVVEFLASAGVRRFYTVPGESFLEIIDAVDRHPDLRLISTRHESGAAFMADADARLTGVPAVAMGTRAVGAANLAIGVHTAQQGSTPMLVLLGQVETEFLGREAFQEVDLPRFYSEITKHAETVTRPDRAAEAIARAHRLAMSGRPGPAMVAFPADVLAGECPPAPPPVSSRARVVPAAEDLRAIDEALRSASRPVAILGAGARSGRDAVIGLAERYGLGVYTSYRRQDAFPNSHPNYLGHLTFVTAPELTRPLADADLVLVLGCRLSEITTQGYRLPRPGTRVIQVDVSPDVPGAVIPVELAVAARAGDTAAALLALDSPPADRDWSAGHGAYLDASAPDVDHAGTAVHPAHVIAAMRRHLPADAVLVNDAGNFSVFAHQYWRFDHPCTQIGPVSGAMGYGVPGAVGAQLAAPGRPVVALAGDGGFLMTGLELETAVREGAPVLVVVFQNRIHGTIAMHQARTLGQTAGIDIGGVDLAGLARSLGADAITVDRPDDLDEAFAAARGFGRPRLIAVRTDTDVLTPRATLSGLLPGPERG